MENNSNILNELKEAGAVTLINAGNKNHFSIPDNYFNSLAPDVLTNIFIQSLPSVNVYVVPELYFENLPGVILDKIILSKGLQATSKNEETTYSVPEGYFNDLADNILSKIKASANPVQQELEEISPFLSKIPKINPYSIPDNYFEEINTLTVTSIPKPAGKIISMGSKTRKWLNYAAAACIAAVLFGGGYLYLNDARKNHPVSTLTNGDIQKQISLLSDDEIANYLEDNNNMAVYTNTPADDNQYQNLNVQDMLQNVSDEEIQQYLNEEPEFTTEEKGI